MVRRRFLPDRSQLTLLLVVVIVLVAGMGFVNLGVARNAASSANRTAHAQYDEQLQQSRLLTGALEAAQRGDNIVPKAYDYFAWTLPGVTTVEIQSVPEEESGSTGKTPRAGPPYWSDWWQFLIKP